MSTPYDPRRTAMLLVDPYNDFLSDGGKMWPLLKGVATEVGLLDNLRIAIATARNADVSVLFVPHRRWEATNYEGWGHLNANQQGVNQQQIFAKGTWGGEFHPDLQPHPGDTIVAEHWAQSGFANTDLDMQLKQRGITHVVLVGVVANTCVESTGRFAMELGYHVTLVRDATAAFAPEMMHAAHELNGPTFAHAIVTTSELVLALTARTSH
ncbi:cysteine hydrolase [soil metagenome]